VSVPAIADLGFARLVRLEQRIAGSDTDGLRARWEFGHELLRARDGKGRLPNGYLAQVIKETKTSRAELIYRSKFAAKFPSEAELINAVDQFRSWHAIVRDALPERPRVETSTGWPPLPEGIFRTIVADPPWQYANKATRGAAEDHYPTMALPDLCDLEVEERAADEAHLYLWTTNGFLREAFGVMDAWGFAYKTTLVWVKPQIGMGNYFRSSTEYVLFGVRGGLRTLDCNQRNWFEAPRTQHSAKPDLFFDLVERVSPQPWLEMFARRRRLGWDVWGNEA
jgi:N6-adenosine-specific RNA methylase IME4